MTTQKDGGAAFPTTGDGVAPGISIRDYFAAQAMAALIVEQPESEGASLLTITMTPGMKNRQFWERVAAASYLMADAMLAAREQK